MPSIDQIISGMNASLKPHTIDSVLHHYDCAMAAHRSMLAKGHVRVAEEMRVLADKHLAQIMEVI